MPLCRLWMAVWVACLIAAPVAMAADEPICQKFSFKDKDDNLQNMWYAWA